MRISDDKVRTILSVTKAGLVALAFIGIDVIRKSGGESILDMWSHLVWQNGISVFIIAVATFYFYHFRSELNDTKVNAAIPAILFSAFLIIGICFDEYSSLNILFSSLGGIATALITFCGNYFMFEYIFAVVVKRIELKTGKNSTSRITNILFNHHPMLIPGTIILLCWIPYFIVFYPGAVTWDAFYQLDQFYGIYALNDHHPVLSTVLIGLCMKTGQLFGSDNLGVFIYNLGQSILFSYSFSATFVLMKKFETPIPIRYLLLAYYSLFTVWPVFGQTMVKDTLFSALFLLYIVFIIDYSVALESFADQKLKKFLFAITILLLCLIRKNGIYIVIPTTVILFWVNRKRRDRISVVSAVPLVMYFMYALILIPKFNIETGGFQEALSIPFQQMARYVVKYDKEIPDSEKEIINKVLDYSTIRNEYNPQISDPVKESYLSKATDNDKLDFLKLWGKYFFKSPYTFISATLNNSYGYYCPGAALNSGYGWYHIEDDPKVNTGQFDIYYSSPVYERLGPILKLLPSMLIIIPGIALLYSPGFYTWVLIVFMFIVIRRKLFMAFIPFIPIGITVLICIASPVNTHIRYMLPVMATTPIFCVYIKFLLIRESKERSII